jgi:hypothetical protein
MVEAVLACGDNVLCQVDHISNNKNIKSVIDGSNYGGDRVFDLENEYFMVKNGKLEKIDIK